MRGTGPQLPRQRRRVAPRRTGGSSPASKSGFARLTGEPPAATCAPAHPAYLARQSHRRHRNRPLHKRCRGRTRPRTPNSVANKRLFGVVKQVIRPRNRVPQRLMAFQSPPRSDQQPEAVTKTITHLARGHGRHAGGRQLDGQRYPVQAAANLDRPRPPHRCRPTRSAVTTLCARSTNRLTAAESMPAPTFNEGTGHSCSSAIPNPSRLVVRIVTVAECSKDGFDQIDGGVEEVLAVVEHQQPDPALQRCRDRLRSRYCPFAG